MGAVRRLPPLNESPPRSVDLGTDLTAPRRARRFLHRWCDYLEIRDPPRNSVMLVGSELVTNAVVHGTGPVTLIVTPEHGALHLAVHDESPRRPTYTLAAPGAVGGRGLFIVEELAASWGVEDGIDGKTVWCRVGCRPELPPFL